MQHTTKKSKTETPHRQWWIKFDNITGKIYRLSPKFIEKNDDNISTVHEFGHLTIIADILAGKISLKKCKIVEDFTTGQPDIVTKSNSLVLQSSDVVKFKQIKGKNPQSADVCLELFKDTSIIEMTLNVSNIKQHMKINEIHEVQLAEGTQFNLYITEKNQPDYLLQTIEIDPLLLFKQKKVQVKLESIASLENISIFTNPIFKSYSFIISQTDVNANNTFNQTNQSIQQSITSNEQKHLTFQRNILNDKEFYVNSGLLSTDNKYILQSQKELDIIVCDTTPDNFVGGISLKCQDLIQQNNQTISTGFKLPRKPIFLYQCKELQINYIGE